MNFFAILAIFAALIPDALRADEPAEQVVVTGTRTEHTSWDSPVPTQTIVIDDEKLQHYHNVAEALARTPGLDLVNGVRGQSIRLDGLDPKYTLVLIDGQRIGGRISEAYDLRSIELDGVQRIEIIRGSGSALYGSDAIGGVINIITRNSVKHRVKIHADTNGQKDALLATGVKGDNASVSIDVFANKDRAQQLDGTETTTFSGSEKIGTQIVSRLSGENWELKGRLQGSQETLDATEVSTAGAVLKRTNDLDHYSVGLEPSYHFADQSSLKATAKHDQIRDDYQLKLRRTGAKQTHEITNEKILETGIEYTKPISMQVFNLGFQNIDEVLASDRLDNDSVDRNRSAVWLQDEITFADGVFTLIPAVRQDYDTQFDSHTSPKLGLRYSPDESNAFMLSYGEGYRAPSFKELYLLFENTSVGYVVEGNEDLTPETSRQIRAQYNFRNKGEWTIGIGAFHNVIKDLIEEVILDRDAGGTMRYSYANIAAAETSGADLSYWRKLSARWNLEVSYNFLYARDLSTQEALLGRSKHSIAYQLQYDKGNWSAAHQLKWQSPREQGENSDLGNPRAIVNGDLSLTYRQDKTWLYSIALENIGASNGDIYWRIPRRSLSLSLTWIPFT